MPYVQGGIVIDLKEIAGVLNRKARVKIVTKPGCGDEKYIELNRRCYLSPGYLCGNQCPALRSVALVNGTVVQELRLLCVATKEEGIKVAVIKIDGQKE
jgi:hypothetical protein